MLVEEAEGTVDGDLLQWNGVLLKPGTVPIGNFSGIKSYKYTYFFANTIRCIVQADGVKRGNRLLRVAI